MVQFFTNSEDQALHVSVLAAVEVRSATRRRQYAGDLEEHDAAVVISTLMQETGRIIEHPITAPVIAEATAMVDRHGLRALDSIQLATALVARTNVRGAGSFTFVASDHKLLKAAKSEGFEVWDPATDSLNVGSGF